MIDGGVILDLAVGADLHLEVDVDALGEHAVVADAGALAHLHPVPDLDVVTDDRRRRDLGGGMDEGGHQSACYQRRRALTRQAARP
jgi:hypothetical protein